MKTITLLCGLFMLAACNDREPPVPAPGGLPTCSKTQPPPCEEPEPKHPIDRR